MSGEVAAHGLASWLDLPIMSFIEGRSQFDLNLLVDDSNTTLNVSSDLAGVALNFPDAMGKRSGDAATFTMGWRMRDADQPMHLSIDDRLSAQFLFNQFQFHNAQIALGSEAQTLLSELLDKRSLVPREDFGKREFAAVGANYRCN